VTGHDKNLVDSSGISGICHNPSPSGAESWHPTSSGAPRPSPMPSQPRLSRRPCGATGYGVTHGAIGGSGYCSSVSWQPPPACLKNHSLDATPDRVSGPLCRVGQLSRNLGELAVTALAPFCLIRLSHSLLSQVPENCRVDETRTGWHAWDTRVDVRTRRHRCLNSTVRLPSRRYRLSRHVCADLEGAASRFAPQQHLALSRSSGSVTSVRRTSSRCE
jgi:hypothetical protein